ncbi:MAG: glycoside hydrolase, partial [Chloroflexi bacterium]
MAAKKPATYCNPFWTESFPDPFVLKVRGRYYAYATEHETYPPADSWVFPILTSSDLVQWREIGKAMPAFGQPYGRYWAPEVTVHNGQFLLYYAVHTSEFTGGIRVAVADRPEGPFTDSGQDLTSSLFPWAIDPHVFRDQDGQWYLYMTIEYWDDPGGFIGSGNIVDRLIDPFTLQGHPTRVTSPQHQWQLFEAQREARGGVDWYTVEGPAVMRHRG